MLSGCHFISGMAHSAGRQPNGDAHIGMSMLCLAVTRRRAQHTVNQCWMSLCCLGKSAAWEPCRGGAAWRELPPISCFALGLSPILLAVLFAEALLLEIRERPQIQWRSATLETSGWPVLYVCALPLRPQKENCRSTLPSARQMVNHSNDMFGIH